MKVAGPATGWTGLPQGNDADRDRQVAFEDVSLLPPSGGVPASFMATPVFDARAKLIGVMALQPRSSRSTP